MAATHWHRKAGSLDYAIWDGTGTTDIATLAGEGVVITIPAIIVTPSGGDPVTVASGQYFCKDSEGVFSAQTLTAIAVQYEEPA